MLFFLRFFLKLLSIAILVGSFSHFSFSEEHIVEMVSEGNKMFFKPENLTVKIGDTITWVNKTKVTHNIKANQKDVPLGAKPIASDWIKKENEKWSYEFKIAGLYKYFCVPHKAMGMVGSITVEE